MDTVAITAKDDDIKSSFVFALLKAISNKFQEFPEASQRTSVINLRRDLSQILAYPDPNRGGTNTIWESISNGALVIEAFRELIEYGQQLPNRHLVDYSVNGVKAMLNSATEIKEPLYDLFAQALNIQIHVLKETPDGYTAYGIGNTLALAETHGHSTSETTVLLYRYLDGHYETIGVMDDVGCKTVFTREDSIVTWLHEVFPESLYKRAQPDLDTALVLGIAAWKASAWNSR